MSLRGAAVIMRRLGDTGEKLQRVSESINRKTNHPHTKAQDEWLTGQSGYHLRVSFSDYTVYEGDVVLRGS